MKRAPVTKDLLKGVECLDGQTCRLEVNYCIPNVESDTNVFTAIVNRNVKDSIRSACIECVVAARAWAIGSRENYPEFSAWDKAGNHY